MSPLLIAMLAVLLVPLFVATWRTSLLGLSAQGLLMAWLAYRMGLPSEVEDWLTLIDLAVVRGVWAPFALYSVLRSQNAPPRSDVIPPNLLSWTAAFGLVVVAFSFSERLIPDGTHDQTLVAVASAGVLLGFLVLATQSEPLGQMTGALRIENAISLFELGGARHGVPLPLRAAQLCVAVLTIALFMWHLRNLGTQVGTAGAAPSTSPSGGVLPGVPGRRDALTSLAEIVRPAVSRIGFMARAARARAPTLLVAVALLSTLVAIGIAVGPTRSAVLGGYLRVDATSRLFLAVVNPIFLGIAVYVWNRVSAAPALGIGSRRFAVLALVFLVAANTVLVANHLLVLWLALEATTLAATPLIVRAGVRASQLASWRYLLFSTVGLGLFLLGLVCLARGMELGGDPTFFVDELRKAAPGGTNVWTKLGLALTLLGLGTKLGLAPMYSWLPEAYDEAPPAVTALLAAVQFNCTLVVLFRMVQIYRNAEGATVSGALLTMGVVSMLVSTLNLIATRNFRRVIAYASINHAGVIAIGLGVGKEASYGLLLYVISNAFIKAIVFLTAGRINAHYKTTDTRQIAGLLQHLPYSGVFLMVGTFALLGLPPFGSFLGELLILSALIESNQMLVFTAFCILITMSFVATGRTIFPMIWGEPKEAHDWPRQTFLSASPKIAFLVVLVVLGIHIPPVVNDLMQIVAKSLGSR